MVRVVTVLRSGGDFKPEHVQALHRQIERWLPGADAVCLTNVDVPGVRTLRLQYGWPGWWSKMELFRPGIADDLLFMDLDTVAVGPLDEVAGQQQLTTLSDFLRPDRVASGVMFLPENAREAVWTHWMTNPHAFMQGKHGDQGFLKTLWQDKAARWQDVLPGQIVSYKMHVKLNNEAVPANARLVAFHGKPRPWDLPKSHPLYEAAGY